MERKYIIYQHTTPSGKVYIGQTCQTPNNRWKGGAGYIHCKLFYCSIKKYGWDNIDHQILHTGLTKEKADILEKMYISFFKRKNISLNIVDGGGDGTTGYHHSVESRKKMSESHKGKVLSEDTRGKLSKVWKGKVHTEETKRKMSESHKGRPKKRSIWLNEFNQEVVMANASVAHHHPNWIKVRSL